jgi:hypothetical protein
MSFDAEAEVKKLAEEIVHLNSDIARLQRQQSSRKGDPGPKGDSVQGLPGRDAVLIVKTDTETNTIHVFDETGAERASLISIPGKDGKDSPTLEEIVKAVPKPKEGKDGRNAPSLQEIVTSVLAEIHRRTSN